MTELKRGRRPKYRVVKTPKPVKALIDYFESRGAMSEAEMAEALEIDRSSMNRIKNGFWCSPANARKIEALTDGRVPKEAIRPDVFAPGDA